MTSEATSKPPVYFFGCWDRAGHFLHEPGGRAPHRPNLGPLGNGDVLDGGFTPGPHRPSYSEKRNPEDETAVSLTQFQGWTILSMWDRTVDKRGACNAEFVAEGLHDLAEMWALAREHFPQIVARLKAAPPEVTR